MILTERKNLTKDQDEAKVAAGSRQAREPEEPFHAAEVKHRVKRFLEAPEAIVFSTHALESMERRDIESTDVYNVMRGGAAWDGFRECQAGRWRYCMGTRKFRVMFVFDEDALVIITAIRLES